VRSENVRAYAENRTGNNPASPINHLSIIRLKDGESMAEIGPTIPLNDSEGFSVKSDTESSRKKIRVLVF